MTFKGKTVNVFIKTVTDSEKDIEHVHIGASLSIRIRLDSFFFDPDPHLSRGSDKDTDPKVAAVSDPTPGLRF